MPFHVRTGRKGFYAADVERHLADVTAMYKLESEAGKEEQLQLAAAVAACNEAMAPASSPCVDVATGTDTYAPSPRHLALIATRNGQAV